jgi:hypothetical protein
VGGVKKLIGRLRLPRSGRRALDSRLSLPPKGIGIRARDSPEQDSDRGGTSAAVPDRQRGVVGFTAAARVAPEAPVPRRPAAVSHARQAEARF